MSLPGSKAFWWSIAVSVGLHLLLLVGAFHASIRRQFWDVPRDPPHLADAADRSDRRLEPQHVSPSPAAAPATVLPRHDSSGVSDTALMDRLTEEETRAKSASAHDLRQTLEVKASVLAQMDSESVDAAAARVESLSSPGSSAPGRAFEPRQGVPGDFDHASAVIYDVQPIAAASAIVPVGQSASPGTDVVARYRWTLVDSEGRSFAYELAESEMTDQDRALTRAFELGRQDPNMRRLILAAMRIATARLDAGSQAEPSDVPSTSAPALESSPK